MATYQSEQSPKGSPKQSPKYRQTELFLDLDIYEGPLDLLLELVRTHKIDITNLPLVKLVDQYLAFLKQADAHNLAISADYLAMAAYLVWLKSLRLIPEEEAEEEASDFSLHLERYAALREAASSLMEQPSLAREFWVSLAPSLVIKETPFAEADLYALLAAKVQMETRKGLLHIPPATPVYMQEEAMEHLTKIVTRQMETGKQLSLEKVFPPKFRTTKDKTYRRSVVASVFCAALEMTRMGYISLTPAAPMPLVTKLKAPSEEPTA